jgi:hypothetical protein
MPPLKGLLRLVFRFPMRISVVLVPGPREPRSLGAGVASTSSVRK